MRLPGIVDGKLFRRNFRQSLGISNKVNEVLRDTLVHPEKSKNFFFFRNGITALCRSITVSANKKKLNVNGLSVVNGCHSLSTIYSSWKVAKKGGTPKSSVLFRFYEISQYDLGEAIGINTNFQSAAKPRDLRNNDK